MQGIEGINLAIPDAAWRPCGDADEPGGERAVLSTVIHIGGTGHHVVAVVGQASGSTEWWVNGRTVREPALVGRADRD